MKMAEYASAAAATHVVSERVRERVVCVCERVYVCVCVCMCVYVCANAECGLLLVVGFFEGRVWALQSSSYYRCPRWRGFA